MATPRRGVHRPLEDEANRLIREGFRGVTKHSEKSDILTPWKEASRKRREVYVASGVPDESTRRGIYNRVANTRNPDLNSRDGVSRPRAAAHTTLSDFVTENGYDHD